MRLRELHKLKNKSFISFGLEPATFRLAVKAGTINNCVMVLNFLGSLLLHVFYRVYRQICFHNNEYQNTTDYPVLSICMRRNSKIYFTSVICERRSNYKSSLTSTVRNFSLIYLFILFLTLKTEVAYGGG
jgi:hypothetical protein